MHVWRITHRCHKKEFLMKFAKDRRGWLNWLFEAKNRHGIIILNHMYSSDILLKYLTILDQPLFCLVHFGGLYPDCLLYTSDAADE